MYTLTYTAEFEISDYESATKDYEVEYETMDKAIDRAHQLYFDFNILGPERYYNIRIDGKPLFVPIVADDDLPF